MQFKSVKRDLSNAGGSRVCFNIELEDKGGAQLATEDLMQLAEVLPRLARRMQREKGGLEEESGEDRDEDVDEEAMNAKRRRILARFKGFSA